MHPFLARIISVFTHPLLIVWYMLLILLLSYPYAFSVHDLRETRAVILLFSVFSTTFILPVAGVLIMRGLGMIQSLEMEDKQERIGPYIVAGIFYLWLFKNLIAGAGAVPLFYTVCVLGATIGLFFAFFFNIFTKISAHATGMGGFIAMLVLANFEWEGASVILGSLQISMVLILVLAVFLAGLTGMARLSLNAHTPADLYRGYIAGFLAVLIANAVI